MAGHVRGAVMMPRLGAQDLVEIRELLARFGHVFDNGDADGMGEVLTEDGVVEGVIGVGYTIPGLQAAKEFTRRRRPDTPDHNTVGTIVFVDAQGVVRARSRYLAPLVDGSVHAPGTSSTSCGAPRKAGGSPTGSRCRAGRRCRPARRRPSSSTPGAPRPATWAFPAVTRRRSSWLKTRRERQEPGLARDASWSGRGRRQLWSGCAVATRSPS